jgi:Phosphotransferase enzyme family
VTPLLKHATFDLHLHTTPELEGLLGEAVAERQQIHGWPFSAVERLTTASGRRWIYKTQRTPTFEPDFYERVRSPLLPASRLLTRDETYSTMLFEFVDAPLVRDLELSDADLARHGRALVAAIGGIEADVPVYIDVSDMALWTAFVDATLAMLGELVTDGRLTLAVDSDVGDVAAWAASDDVRNLIERTARLTHGDLNPGNVFVMGDGHRVIDWQRPQLAPADVDLVALLEGRPDLFRHAPAAAIGVFYLLRLYWAANAKANLLPNVQRLFDRWSSDAIGFIRRAAAASV